MSKVFRLLRKVMAYLTGLWPAVPLLILIGGCPTAIAADVQLYDVLIRGGTIYDGTLKPPYVADIGIKGDRIVGMGNLDGEAVKTIDAGGGHRHARLYRYSRTLRHDFGSGCFR